MKGLRIVFGLMAMGLLWLSLPASAQLAPDAPMAVEPKAPQGDTLRMTLTVEYRRSKTFYFWGEKDATYKVEWGDGETSTATGKGYGRYDDEDRVECSHTYSQLGEYTVKLYGVAAGQKKRNKVPVLPDNGKINNK